MRGRMKGFRRVLREVNKNLNSISLFNVFLSAIVLFLALYLALSLTTYNAIYAIYPSLIYLAVLSFLKLKENKYRKVEAKYAELDEKLRTAADNVHLENPVVEDLQREVIENMKYVEVSSFLDTRKISLKIITAVVLCFMILFLTSFDVPPVEIKSFVGGLITDIGLKSPVNRTATTFSGGPGGVGGIPGEGDIFGGISGMGLGTREEDIEIAASGYEVDVRDITEAKPQSFEEQFPQEVFVQGASAFEENIPKEQQELVKNYFEKLAQG